MITTCIEDGIVQPEHGHMEQKSELLGEMEDRMNECNCVLLSHVVLRALKRNLIFAQLLYQFGKESSAAAPAAAAAAVRGLNNKQFASSYKQRFMTNMIPCNAKLCTQNPKS